VLNYEAVRLATRAAIALCCTIRPRSVFARKNYFYPDLPKGYQISQYDRPLAEHGHLVIGTNEDGSPITVGITRVHMEEDAGKSIHDRYPGFSAIDLNRSGVPLIEIVSEPDMRSSKEAGAYLRALKQIIEYLDVSDANMEAGSLRVDANISIRPCGETSLGTKTEVKNLNSFSGVERALESEFLRQAAVVDAGGTVEQHTMLWDGARGEVRPARSKEASHDYRYFPEPDLPPLVLAPEWIARVREDLPELPRERRARFAEAYALPDADVEVLTSSAALSEYFESVARQHGDAKPAANWVMGEVLATVNATNTPLERFKVRPMDLAALLDMIRDGIVSHSAAKRVFAHMATTGDRPGQIAERLGVLQERDADTLASWMDAVIAEHPAEWERYRKGERKLQGVLVGQVMKKSGGRADPRQVNQLLVERAAV
jgi:aspartyl-tRNA(Asn)/glutamyl-tRNA(Gln) amidotransferase subunit B